MKIQIENKGDYVSIKLDDKLNKREAVKLFESLYDLFTKTFREDTEDCNNVATVVPEPIKASVKTTQKAQEFNIRPRIPNTLVDVKDLTIEQAVTENALVRCPNCGQAHCLAVPSGNRIYLMRRNYKKNEFCIIAEFDSMTSDEFIGVCCDDTTDRKAYFEDLQQFTFKNEVNFAVNNETELFCPVCCTSNTFNVWKDAFEHPLHFFETEHICDACGGEKVERLIKDAKVYQCESCGLQMDYEEEQ